MSANGAFDLGGGTIQYSIYICMLQSVVWWELEFCKVQYTHCPRLILKLVIFVK